MIDSLHPLRPATQAFIATMFTWGVTPAGASLVRFSKPPKKYKKVDMVTLVGFSVMMILGVALG